MDRYKWAVQALSQAADVQLSLFPNFVVVADELALDYEEGYLQLLETWPGKLTPIQREAVEKLEAHLLAMSGPNHPHLWTNEGLLSEQWAECRRLSKRVLEVMEWPLELPPADRGFIYIYIPSGEPSSR
jgi:hypothetical protein